MHKINWKGGGGGALDGILQVMHLKVLEMIKAHFLKHLAEMV